MGTRDIAVVLVAAGRGERLGADKPKAFVELAGRTLISHSLENIVAVANLVQVIVAVPKELIAEANQLVSAHHLTDVSFAVVAGGRTRQESISLALQNLDSQVAVVLVHDAARALAPTELFDRVASRVRETKGAVIPALPVVDTVKRISDDLILETVDRESLVSAQTPQGFLAAELTEVYAAAQAEFTDDAALFQSFGKSVSHISGTRRAFKITTPEDLTSAELLFGVDVRTGIGTDVHSFTSDPEKPLFLGTVIWPGELGLEGHSDGDAVSHAIVDALLSAAGLGDIGSNFGVDRPEFAGANGSVFISETLRLIAQHGFQVRNIAVQIIGNRPKVAPHRERVEAALFELIKAPVSLSATTTDGLGFLGNSEGVAAVATALIARPNSSPIDRLGA